MSIRRGGPQKCHALVRVRHQGLENYTYYNTLMAARESEWLWGLGRVSSKGFSMLLHRDTLVAARRGLRYSLFSAIPPNLPFLL